MAGFACARQFGAHSVSFVLGVGLPLLAIVGFALIDQLEAILAEAALLGAASALFTLIMLTVGGSLPLVATPHRAARRALLFGFPARNVSIATLISVAALRRMDFASFGVVFFLVKAAALVLASRPAPAEAR